MRYPWKDNIQLFHLVPKEVMYVQQFGCKQVVKIMATSRTPSFMSDTSISSSLYLSDAIIIRVVKSSRRARSKVHEPEICQTIFAFMGL